MEIESKQTFFIQPDPTLSTFSFDTLRLLEYDLEIGISLVYFYGDGYTQRVREIELLHQ